MKNIEYKVVAELCKPLFRPPKMYYNVVMVGDVLKYPMHMNMNTHRRSTRFIAKFETESEAEDACKILNRLK